MIMKRTSTQLKKTTSDSCSSFLRNYVIVLLLVFLGSKAMAQPCTAHRWVAGAHWNADGTINDKPNAPAPLGIIRCGSSAETENSLFNFKGKYHASDFQIVTGAAPCVNPDGGSTTVNNPVENQDIVWMNFDIRPYAGTFQYQITPGGGELGWALYVAGKQPGVNSNGLSGNCSSLTYVKCGISATGWVTVEVPSFTEPANYYIAMWRNNGQ